MEAIETLAKEIAAHAILAIERAVGVRGRLDGVVAPDEADDFEVAAQELVDGLNPTQFTAMSEVVKRARREPTSDRRAQLGQLSALKLDTPKSLKKQIDAVPFGERYGQGRAIRNAVARRSATKAARQLIDEVRERMGTKELGPPRLELSLRSQEDIEELASPRLVTIDEETLAALMTQARSTGQFNPQWTFEVEHNAIQTKYIRLGGASGPLGEKDGIEGFDEDADGRTFRYQRYENGIIILGPSPRAHAIWGPVYEKWLDLPGLELRHIGVPMITQRTTPDRIGGRYCHFFGNGSIYFHPLRGAHEVHGAIRQKWASLNWERGSLGYPTSDELPSREPAPFGPFGALSTFEEGVIYWSARHGAHALPDAINQIYQQMHAELGNLGYPILTSNLDDGLLPVLFEGGRITVINGTPQLQSIVSAVSTRILNVRANRTTSEIGRDEMHLTCVGVDSLGRKEVWRQYLGEFNNGLVKQPGDYYSINIGLRDTPHPWPRTYVFAFFLTEMDGGLADDFTSKIIDAVKSSLESRLNEALSVLGETIPALGTAVGAGLGPVAAAAWLAILGPVLKRTLERVFDYLQGGFGEDVVFPPIVAEIKLDTCVHYKDPIAQIENHWHILEDVTETTSAGGGTYEIHYQTLVGPVNSG